MLEPKVIEIRADFARLKTFIQEFLKSQKTSILYIWITDRISKKKSKGIQYSLVNDSYDEVGHGSKGEMPHPDEEMEFWVGGSLVFGEVKGESSSGEEGGRPVFQQPAHRGWKHQAYK